MRRTSRLLSKSKYLAGLQCSKYLWLLCNDPEKIPPPDASTQHIFDQGHEVGDLAHSLYPHGARVPTDNFMANIKLTKELLGEKKPLFEAGVLAGDLYSRLDILTPAEGGKWDIVEVKSSTSVKEVNLHDVSFQRLCCEEGGLPIRNCYLAYINNQYVKRGKVDPAELFIVQDISDEVEAVSEGIRDRVAYMREVIGAPECPVENIGAHCGDPYPCQLGECWQGLPEHNVFTLYYGGKRAQELYNTGVLDIADIPASCTLNGKQRIQRACVASGSPHVDRDELKRFLASLVHPLYFLDFETFGTAIPLFDGTRPYQNIPFQSSLHVQRTSSGNVKHFSFLAEGKEDPRSALLTSLSRLIGESGTVIAYNKSFEENVLKDSALAYPEFSGWAESVTSRLVDLMMPFRSFYYYHPSQKGSASLKSVLPAVTGKGYEDMAIARGDDASLAFLHITFDNASAEEVAKTREELLAYCALDTEGMVRIVGRLMEIAG